MKKSLKVISMILVVVSVFSIFAINASAVATPLDAGSTKATATNIPEFGTEYVSELSVDGEEDWFKFTTLPDDAYYTYTFKNYNMYGYDLGEVGNSTYSPNIYLYDTYLQQIICSYNSSTRNLKLEPNTVYYIKVKHEGYKMKTGNYSITLDYKYDVEENDMQNAFPLSLNSENIQSLDGWGDVDWFKFTTKNAGEYEIMFKNHDMPYYNYGEIGDSLKAPNIFVYDVESREITHGYNSCTRVLTLEANTTYYVKVVIGNGKSKDVGNYSINITDKNAKSLSHITIDSMPNKTTYVVGDTFDKTGLVVTAHYSDGTTAKVTSYMVSGFDSSSEGTKTITVGYAEEGVVKTATFNVVVETEQAGDTIDCGCNCHKSGISKFFFNFLLFFQKLFGSNQYCECGVAHY